MTNCGAANEVVAGSAALMQQSEPFSASASDGQQECSFSDSAAAADARDITQEHDPMNSASAAARIVFPFMSTV